MLRIIQNRAAGSAKSYYAHSDYLSEGQELTGRWGGRAARMLGLSGDVEKLSFDRLCDNLDPRSGEQLTLRTNGDRTVGYDFNFHLSKGVSLAYTLGKDERILDAFRESVEETMQEIEQEAKTRVRKYGAEADRTTGNLAWATFIHKTARPVNGEPDPHIHAHAFVFNTTWDQKEQAWKAGQFRDLKRDAPYWEAAFHARMAGRMRKLGYKIRRYGKSWDIAEVPKSLSDKFSRRTDQIEEMARRLGIETDSKKDGLGAKSREKKQSSMGMTELGERWRERLSDDERELVDQLLDDAMRREQHQKDIEAEQEVASMQHATEHCFERSSVVPVKSLLAEALRHGVGQVSVEGMHRQLDTQKILRREIEGRMQATTHEVLAEEQQLLRFAREGIGAESALNPDWQIKEEWLNADQQNAVRHVLSSKDRLMIIRGGAGTGKTSLMREAVNGMEAAGKQVFTFAPSSDASRGTLRSEGFDATTVAELLVNRELQQKIENQVIWIDEAGLLGSRTLKRVTDLAESKNARVVLSGDWRQHGSVERGAAMRLLEQQSGVKVAIVGKIQRQYGQYRDAVALLAEGLTEDGFDLLHRMGWVRETEDDGERFRTMAKEYAAISERGETVLATAPTHAEGELLTAVIRDELMQRGQLDKKSQSFTQLRPLHFTKAEKADGERIGEGDVIVLSQNVKGYRRGQRLVVQDGVPKTLREHADRYEVYSPQTIDLAKGDVIRMTAGGKTKDGQHRLDTGTVYQIRGFTDDGDIQLNNGWVVGRDHGFIAHGYVSTSHAAQGKTVDHVLVAESSISFAAAGREQFYVSVSRGRQSATIFTDNRGMLADAIAKSDRRMTATELLQDSRDRDDRIRRNERAKASRKAREQVVPRTRQQERIYE